MPADTTVFTGDIHFHDGSTAASVLVPAADSEAAAERRLRELYGGYCGGIHRIEHVRAVATFAVNQA